MKEVVQQQQRTQSQKTKHKKGNEVLTQAILTFPSQQKEGPIHVPVLMQMPSNFFQRTQESQRTDRKDKIYQFVGKDYEQEQEDKRHREYAEHVTREFNKLSSLERK